MEIIRFSQCPSTPWKNGAGITSQLLIAPPNASLDDFDFRISMARVGSDGPFSIFEGIDRQLLILEGRGLALEIAGREEEMILPLSLSLSGQDPALAFAGELEINSRLLDGPVLDFNVMTRRGHYRAKTERVRLGKHPALSEDCLSQRCLLLFLAPAHCLTGKNMPALELQTHDILSYGAGETIALQPTADTDIIRVWLDRAIDAA